MKELLLECDFFKTSNETKNVTFQGYFSPEKRQESFFTIFESSFISKKIRLTKNVRLIYDDSVP